jgi:GTPase SAR1 family protein
MVQLIVGVKGTGKTKLLIDMVNRAVDNTPGAVVCVEKGTKLIHEIKYQARLIDTDEYDIKDAHALYGFISGICASNHDVTDVFVDSALKICGNNLEEFVKFIQNLDAMTQTHNINIVMTSSIPADEIPEQIKKYITEH